MKERLRGHTDKVKPLVYTYAQVMKILGIGKISVYNLVKSGVLKRVYILYGSPRITAESLRHYCTAHDIETEEI